ncbi:MAG TPA: universal stress protein [Solirubrobacteraceae bacterium]|nr:universal stress protein [Solirubrobacteraceae bacterium]
MSTVEITGPVSADAGGRTTAAPDGGVMVVYERGAAGRAALLHAHRLAGAHAPLTVVAVASRERTDMGCGSCRQGAAFRNELACEGAEMALHEARTVLSAASPGAVRYALARGTFRRAVLQAARDHRAGVIVLPARGAGRLRRLFSRDRVKLLEGRTTASVVVAPDAG